MQRCFAFMTTPTPSAPVSAITASAISSVMRSCIWSLRAYMSTMRASFDTPSTFPCEM